MLRKLFLLLLSIAVCCPIAHAKPSQSHPSSSSSKTVHVRGYYKKDGTYVAPHDRSAPGTATHGGGISSPASVPRRAYRSGQVATGYSAHSSVSVDSHGKIKRSAAAKDAFKRQQPCPSTGKPSGACPGYVIDHVKPLECGGPDAPSNMQWQTIADGKAKDKIERYCQ